MEQVNPSPHHEQDDTSAIETLRAETIARVRTFNTELEALQKQHTSWSQELHEHTETEREQFEVTRTFSRHVAITEAEYSVTKEYQNFLQRRNIANLESRGEKELDLVSCWFDQEGVLDLTPYCGVIPIPTSCSASSVTTWATIVETLREDVGVSDADGPLGIYISGEYIGIASKVAEVPSVVTSSDIGLAMLEDTATPRVLLVRTGMASLPRTVKVFVIQGSVVAMEGVRGQVYASKKEVDQVSKGAQGFVDQYIQGLFPKCTYVAQLEVHTSQADDDEGGECSFYLLRIQSFELENYEFFTVSDLYGAKKLQEKYGGAGKGPSPVFRYDSEAGKKESLSSGGVTTISGNGGSSGNGGALRSLCLNLAIAAGAICTGMLIAQKRK
eukprot:PhF_6_TR37201/c0_g1_i3/m.54824